MGVDIAHGGGHGVGLVSGELCAAGEVRSDNGAGIVSSDDPLGVGLQLEIGELQVVLVEIINEAAAAHR